MKIASILCLAMFLCCGLSQAQQERKQEKIIVVGTVIAYEQSPWRNSKLSSLEKGEVTIIRVDTLIKGKEKSKYLKVLYRYFSYKDALPTKMFQEGNKGRFTLSRNTTCDNSISKEYPESQRSDVIAGDDKAMVYLVPVGLLDTHLPTEDILPCYFLSTKSYKPERQKRAN